MYLRTIRCIDDAKPKGMIVSAIITSVYSIGLISVDRYLYIVYGLQYQRYIYPLRARIMIVSTWILGKYTAHT